MTFTRIAGQARRFAVITAVIAGLATFGAPKSAQTHPHVWVDAFATLHVLDDGRAETVTVNYALDDLTTAFLLEGLTRDENGVLDADEMRLLASDNAEALKEFDYFIEVQAQGARVPVREVASYDYSYENNRLVLSLTLALETAVEPRAQRLNVRLYDPSFYVLVQLVEDRPLRLSGLDPSACRIKVKGPSLASEGVYLSDALLNSFDLNTNIGRDYSDEMSLACGPQG